MSAPPPDPSPADAARQAAVFQFARLQLPAIPLSEAAYTGHLRRAFALYAPKADGPLTWGRFLDGLYAADLLVCGGCLDGLEPAWEHLFAARTGRSDALLVDALRARAARLYPRNEERQESAVDEFWSQLIVPEADGRAAVLARYDGQRPLAPWLIRVFQNLHLSRLRKHDLATSTLPDDDLAVPLPTPARADTRWHERFVAAARDWLAEATDAERLLLGLRWRYRLSQREAAHLLGVHEGTVSRQTDKLRDHALEVIGGKLVAEGWTGDDLAELVNSEMGAVLVDDPRLSADQLAKLLGAKGISLGDPGEHPGRRAAAQ